MTQDLQQLLDRIRQEGVEKAQDEAKAIIEKAHAEADALMAKTKAEAETYRKNAEREAEAFSRRAEASIRQAGRDVQIQVEQELIKTLERLLRGEIEQAAADASALEVWISDAVAAYLKGGDAEVEVVLGGRAAEQAAGLVQRLRNRAADGKGFTVSPNPAFPNGFSLRLEGGRVEHSFTAEAITTALSRLLRPQLVKLLQSAE